MIYKSGQLNLVKVKIQFRNTVGELNYATKERLLS